MPSEQVVHCAPSECIAPAGPPMSGGVMQHVASLAKRGEVAGHVLAEIVVEMGVGQHHMRDGQLRIGSEAREPWLAGLDHLKRGQPPHAPPLTIAPASALLVPPPAIAQVGDPLAVWPAAALAATLSAIKANDCGKLAPVEGIEPAVYGSDRHGGTCAARDDASKEVRRRSDSSSVQNSSVAI